MKNKKKTNITNQNGKPKPKMLGKENKYMHLLKVGIIILLGIIIYSNSFDCSFQLDDKSSIIDNQVIRDVTDVNSIWKSSQSRFISYLSLAANYHFGELNVWGYHFLNLIIHLINACLVYWLTLLIFSAPALKSYAITKDKNIIAFITALLFISHPLATQSVTYIVQRMASLVAMFYFLSLVLYMKGRCIKKLNQTKYLFFAGSIIAAILAMHSKENAFTLPFAIVLFEILCFQTRKLSINIKDYRVLTVLVLLLGFIFVVLSNFPLTSILKTHPPNEHNNFTNITPINYLFTQFSVIIKYIQLLLLPINQNLDYDFPISKSFFELRTIFSFLCLLFLVIFAFFKYKKDRIITFGILWFFLTLSIESSIIPIDDVIFEHRTYLPSFGLFIVVSSGLYLLLWEKHKYIMIAIMVCIIGSNSFLTFERNKVWKTEITLWSDVISKSPNKSRGYYNRGNGYRALGKLNESIPDYTKSLAIHPRKTKAYLNRGIVYVNLGKIAEGVADFNKAIEINPEFKIAYMNRGIAYEKLGQLNKSIDDLTNAIRLDSKYAIALLNRGNSFFKLGQLDQAIKDYTSTIELGSAFKEAFYSRSLILGRFNKLEEAILDCNQAISIDPDFGDAYFIRGCFYFEINQYSNAITDFTNSININPNSAKIYYSRGLAYENLNQLENAKADFEKAIVISPDMSNAIINRDISVRSLSGR